MRENLHKNTHGGKKVFLFILILVVLSGIGFAAWRLIGQGDQSNEAGITKNKVPCESDDKVICKFVENWEPSSSYRFTVNDTTNGTETTTVYEYELGDPDKIHTTHEGTKSYELITIGNKIYTKAGDVWWLRSVNLENESGDNTSSQPKLGDLEPIQPTHYNLVGQDSCGELRCYKYQVNDPDNPDLKQFIWFDQDEYRLRKLLFEGPGSVSEQTIEYVDVEISAPSPIRELSPNQQIVPGDLSPTSI